MNFETIEKTIETAIQSMRHRPGNSSQIQQAVESISARFATIPGDDLLSSLTTILMTSSSWSAVSISCIEIASLFQRNQLIYNSQIADFCIVAIDNAYTPPTSVDAGMTMVAKNLAKAQMGDIYAKRAVNEYVSSNSALAGLQQSQQGSALVAAIYVTISTHDG